MAKRLVSPILAILLCSSTFAWAQQQPSAGTTAPAAPAAVTVPQTPASNPPPPTILGVVKKSDRRTTLPPPIRVRPGDDCLDLPDGVTATENGAKIALADLAKIPGVHTVTLAGEGKTLEVVLTVTPVTALSFTSEATQVFVNHLKDFSRYLTINGKDLLADWMTKDKVAALPDLTWHAKSDNNEVSLVSGGYTPPQDLQNKQVAVTVTANMSGFATCSPNPSSLTVPPLNFTVLPNPGTLRVDPPTAVLLPNSSLTLTADARLEGGEPATKALIDWKLLPENDSKLRRYITVQPSTGFRVNVLGNFTAADLALEPILNDPIRVQAIWRNASDAGGPLSTDIFIKPALVADFRPIKVKLEPMDDKTVDALFGSGMRKNYWVMRIRLNNNLRDEASDKLLGSSILVFSESMEMAVALEKRLNKKAHSAAYKQPMEKDKSEKAEKDIQKAEDRSYVYAENASEAPGAADAHVNEWTPVSARLDTEGFIDLNPEYRRALQDKNKASEWISNLFVTARGSRPRPGGKLEVWEPGDDAGRMICRSDFFYRPYSYEIVLNTSTVFEELSGRSRTFKVAEAIGLITSVVTAVAVPGASSDLPTGLDKYRNIFIPGMQRLWKDMADTHRQNLVNMTLKPIEELPFGAELSKVVFFPKGSFSGFVRGYDTRISQVCPYYFHATAAVLSNSASQLAPAAAGQSGSNQPKP
ncbi:MAG: hypothetical protein LAO06_02390 [Acidobacteriia bacterium]|nr:hypothetical protein [Terriglobia bacterium]